MTKNTPETRMLRTRMSNLALSLEALRHEATTTTTSASTMNPAPMSSAVPQEGSSISGPRTKESVIADVANNLPAENRICMDCMRRQHPTDYPHVQLGPSDACRLCAIREVKPEAFTKPFCDFITRNPTVFHTVSYFKNQLSDAGFVELPPRDSWVGKLKPGGKYWTTRNGSSLIAFKVGAAYKPGNGIAMVAGHIDALTARLKPISTKRNAAGYVQLGVAPYAGGLNPTWWDRDLSIGGRVVVRDADTGKVSTQLVKLGWPIARIPTLAPHFGVGMMGQNNKETQAVPIIGLDNSDINGSSEAVSTQAPLGPAGSFVNTQPPKLVKLISSELGLDSPSSILDWELELFDSQPAQTGGLDREFIFAPRVDDKLCSWAALTGLLASDDASGDGGIKLVSLFDDEEIGSLLRQGARGNFLPHTVERTVEALSHANVKHANGIMATSGESYGPGLLGRTYASSFLLSADVTHAGNPNFLASYLNEHVPRLNVGLVICADSNGHMTTDAVSTSILRRVAELSDCQTQIFQIRNDSRSGGTVGPMLSSAMGVRAADAGLPQLSMHSIRATTGSLDPGLGVKFFKGFLDRWEDVDAEWKQ